VGRGIDEYVLADPMREVQSWWGRGGQGGVTTRDARHLGEAKPAEARLQGSCRPLEVEEGVVHVGLQRPIGEEHLDLLALHPVGVPRAVDIA